MLTVTIQEAKIHFSKLLQQAKNGEEIIITNAGQPIAKLVPIDNSSMPRIPGVDAGKVIIHDDFDSPLPEFDL